ncbi:MAG: MCE family protein [Bacteriovoracaceae bacterium]|jgi:phospholipid/cholesterol/gamma-HCH transport system substrate-binding protein|nr:MCE family protein [Bacteriovoracaceae bacterium]
MNEFKVGLMALAAMGAIVVMSLKITSNQSGFGDYVSYKTIVRDASGIFPKTPIRVAGINAGRIKNIELIGNNALIYFEVLEKVKVSANSKLRIKSVGFLGDKFLEIHIGDSDRRLEPGGSIVAEEGAGLTKLMKNASEIMKDVKDMVSSMKETLAPSDDVAPIKKILDNVNEITVDARDVMKSLRGALADNDKKLNKTISNFEKFSKQLAHETDGEVDGSSISDLKMILDNAKQMTSDMQDLVADIRNGKGTIGRLLVEDDIIDDVQQTMAGIKKLVTKVDNIRTELSIYSGATTESGSLSSLHLKILPSPERFYLVGVSTSEFGPETEVVTTTSVDGGASSTVTKIEKTKGQWKFDLQLGRTIHDWSFRGGIIESGGGFGIDYNLQSWNQRFSFEVYDYQDNTGINLRLSTIFQIKNVFYGRLSVKSRSKILSDATYAISGGLRFNDEDMKALLGFFF